MWEPLRLNSSNPELSLQWMSPLFIFFQDTVQTGRMQNGMKNEPREVESRALFNVCKQSESNWSSGKGEVFKCDQNE